jgi:hypothetical protein
VKYRSSLFLAFAGLLLLAACGGDEKDPGSGKTDNRVVERYPGGGTGQGAINGYFTLFVEDSDERPISGATVVVEAGGKMFTEMTSGEGRADFEGADIKGPLAVHIFHADYVFRSVYGLNAGVATFGVGRRMVTPDPAPQVATVTGQVTGWEAITAMGTKVAVVDVIGGDSVQVQQRTRMVGMGQLETNIAVNAPNLMLTNYELDFDVRAKTMVVVGGTIDQAGAFTPAAIGVNPAPQASGGAMVTQDVALMQPIDQRINVGVAGPMELTQAQVLLGVELANDGGLFFFGSEQMASATFPAPATTGGFAGATFIAAGFMSAPPMGPDGAEAFTRQRFTTGNANLLAPGLPGKPSASGRQISATAAQGANLHDLTIVEDVSMTESRNVWTVSVVGNVSATLPTPPEGFIDPLTGTRTVYVDAYFFGTDVDMNNVKFEDLDDRPTFGSSARWTDLTF